MGLNSRASTIFLTQEWQDQEGEESESSEASEEEEVRYGAGLS